MFSGKTTEFVSRMRMASIAGQSALLIKNSKDNRYTDRDIITTHSELKQETTSTIKIVQTIELLSLGDISEVVIGIDEGQFYPDIVEFSKKYANMGRRIVIAALDGDFAQKPFGSIPELIPYCEFIEKRHGVCMECRSNKSSFSCRKSKSLEIVEIGGVHEYLSVCRQCYNKIEDIKSNSILATN